METRAPFPLTPAAAFRAGIEELRRGSDLQGALLVSRDGLTIVNACPSIDDPDLFSAMQATALGAAEVALARLGPRAQVTVVADMNGHRFVSRALNDALMVVAMVPTGSDCKGVLTWMDDLARTLSR